MPAGVAQADGVSRNAMYEQLKRDDMLSVNRN